MERINGVKKVTPAHQPGCSSRHRRLRHADFYFAYYISLVKVLTKCEDFKETGAPAITNQQGYQLESVKLLMEFRPLHFDCIKTQQVMNLF